jgi:hypothetical protein
MLYQNIHKKTITALLATLTLAGLGLAPLAHASARGTIVGLWNVHYTSNSGGPALSAFIQWHSDGLEFEGAGLAPGAFCQGTYKQAPDGTYHDYHIAWTFDSSGVLNGWWDEVMVITVSADHQSYSGTYVRDFYDLNGGFLFEDTGTEAATRLKPER